MEKGKASIIIVAEAVAIVVLAFLVAFRPFENQATVADADGDGYPDAVDAFPSEPSQWSDIDGDGYGDNLTGVKPDQFPGDPTDWNDSDGDGVGDNHDAFPHDSTQWSDMDGDGYGDNLSGLNPDHFRDDPTEWNDTDGDGVGDNSDAYPNDPLRWEPEWTDTTPAATYTKASITNGKKVTIVSITRTNVSWDHVTIQISDGTNFASWSPLAADLTGDTVKTKNYSALALGSLTICSWVYDLAGNGYLNPGDFVTFFTYGGADSFSAATTYSVYFIYEPTAEVIGTPMVFTG